MKINRVTQNGWRPVHKRTVLSHVIFPKAEIRAPFRVFWAKLEAETEMETDRGHPEAELFIIVRGRSRLTVGEEEGEVREGDTVYIPPNAAHKLNNDSTEEMTLICVKYSETKASNFR